MSIVAQTTHHRDRLDLGADGRGLFLFRCDKLDPCPSWEDGSGANAGFVLEALGLQWGLLLLPHPEMAVYTEARVIEWTVREDGVPVELFDDFFSDERHPDVEGVPEATKLGSAPLWFQSAGSENGFEGSLPAADEAGCVVHRKVDGEWVPSRPRKKKPGAPDAIYGDDRSWSCANGLSGGLDAPTYVFVRTDGAGTGVRFFWQAT